MGKIKTALIAAGSVIGGLIIAALLFISGRNKQSSGSIKERADRNHNDLRNLNDSDRSRNEESRKDLESKRKIIESDTDELKQQRDLNNKGRDTTRKTRGIIDNARKSISGIIQNSKRADKS